MTEVITPQLDNAHEGTAALAQRPDLGDMVLQGLATDGSGVIQVVGLRRDFRLSRWRTMSSLIYGAAEQPSLAVQTTAVEDGVRSAPYYSMVSSPVPDNSRAVAGSVHIVGSGKGVLGMRNLQVSEKNRGVAHHNTITGLEHGVTQLFGYAIFSTLLGKTTSRRVAESNLLANRQLQRPKNLGKHDSDLRTPTVRPASKPFKMATGYGVALGIFNTVFSLDSDYDDQPVPVSLVPDLSVDGRDLEAIAQHLRGMFQFEALAIRYVPVDAPDARNVTQLIWNAPRPVAENVPEPPSSL